MSHLSELCTKKEKALPLILSIAICGLLGAAAAAPASPLQKRFAVYTKGTNQMAGGSAVFGRVYSYMDNGPLLNLAILKAEYSTGRINFKPGTFYNADATHKLLIIHYRIKNPNKDDLYFSSGGLFQAIDANNNTIKDIGDSRRESQMDMVSVSLKPGQGIDDLVTGIVVPAQGPITKLIVIMGRAGTSDRVTRFTLGKAPNTIVPLPAPYVDPSDPTHSTALTVIKGVVGKTYNAGTLDMSLDSVECQPGPIGNQTAAQGKKFLVATVTFTDKVWGTWYVNDSAIKPTLVTDDDKITDFATFKGKHDEDFGGRSFDPADTATIRLLMQVPTDGSLKTLTLVNDMGDNGISPQFVYDVSGVK